MSQGLGEYFGSAAPSASAPTRDSVQQRPLSVPAASGMGEYFAQPGVSGLGEYGGLGATVRHRGAFHQAARQISPAVRGIGDLSEAAAGVGSLTSTLSTTASTITGLAIRGGVGYYLGSVLAPTKKMEMNYAVGGAAAAVFFDWLGIGLVALIAHHAHEAATGKG